MVSNALSAQLKIKSGDRWLGYYMSVSITSNVMEHYFLGTTHGYHSSALLKVTVRWCKMDSWIYPLRCSSLPQRKTVKKNPTNLNKKGK